MKRLLYKPRPPRWPQLSLRGFFALVTVVGVVLGWLAMQLKWKGDRQAAMDSGEAVCMWVRDWPAPWSLRLFGEQGVRKCYVQVPGDSVSRSARLQETRSLFPEAELSPVVIDDWENVRLFRALDSPTDFDFADTPLQDAMDYFNEYHHLQIQFDIKALEKLRIDPAQDMLSAAQKGIPLRSALEQILSSIDKSLTFMIKDEVLVITSEQQKQNYELRRKQRLAALRARPPQEQSVRLLKALDDLTYFDFAETPLQTAIGAFAGYHGIQIDFDTDALNKLGVTPKVTKVNAAVKGISLRSGLNLLLMRLDDSLTYVMRGDLLVITTREAAGDRAADVTATAHHKNSP